MSTTTFSSMGDILKTKLQKTEEKCEIHDVFKVTAFQKKPVCLECAREKLEKENEELEKELTERHFKRTTYDWLEKNSIILDDTLWDASFDSFEVMDEETEKNKEKARMIAGKYYKGRTFNTIITGKAGAGKSHLAMSILKAVNENIEPSIKCLFVSIDEVMRLIKESFNNKQAEFTEERMITMIVEADLLVIDDLGAEIGAIESDKRASDFTTRVLYAIVNGRMKKSTIITTNLSSAMMAEKYDSKLMSRMLKGTKGHLIKFEKTTDKRISIEF